MFMRKNKKKVYKVGLICFIYNINHRITQVFSNLSLVYETVSNGVWSTCAIFPNGCLNRTQTRLFLSRGGRKTIACYKKDEYRGGVPRFCKTYCLCLTLYDGKNGPKYRRNMIDGTATRQQR